MTSIADQNFGVTAQSILPAVDNNTSLQNATASGSFFDAKSQSVVGNQQTTTSDILFLKRLLFIKASLDNE